MAREDEMLKERLRKIDELRNLKVNPYPYRFEPKNKSADLQTKYSKLKGDELTKDKASVAGRLISVRSFGKIHFAHLADTSGKIQIVIEEGASGKKINEFFSKYIDSGDIVGVEGLMHKTKRGEVSILVKSFELLSKAINTLPDKWHGLQDKEERYRKRYVDLIISPEVRKTFEVRSKIIESVRELLNSKGFVEVETPLLQPVYGGAEARPFVTHLNDLNIDMYMSISPELYLKRLLVGGFDKVYTICKNFRNEGIDKSHNPEFTMMECYWAYADYEDMMDLFEELYENAIKKINGSTEIEYQGQKISFKRPWTRMTMADGIEQYGRFNVDKMTDKDLLKKAEELNIEIDSKLPKGLIIAVLFKNIVEPKLIQPTHVIDQPKETTPLCKAKRGNEDLIERDEPFIAMMEVGNIYSELNDPVLQKKLFEEQAKAAAKKEGTGHPYDKDYLEALGYGMPPAGGLGIGIDRMVMILTNSHSIRDVILFPFMKPENMTEEPAAEKKEEKKEEKKSKSKPTAPAAAKAEKKVSKKTKDKKE